MRQITLRLLLPLRMYLLLVLLAVLIVVGTVGYWLIEKDFSLFDALYMTVITLTTVGYGETHPLSTAGRVFTMALLLVGVFTFFYSATELVRGIVSGEVQQLLGREKMARSLAGLTNHLIVCGYGRMGRHVCREFSRQGVEFVIVDANPEMTKDFNLTGGLAVAGDATSDEVLRRAGVERARGLVAVVPSDADNLYITMSARLINSKLFIVARAEGEECEKKLLRAGADRVIAPYLLGGTRIAQAVMRPTVMEFIELATKTEHLELQIEQTQIVASSPLAGATLTASRLRNDYGLIIVAIKKRHGAMIYTPPPETVMEAGDILIALGRRSQLDQLERLAAGLE
ncbi:MAG: potassium channel protein [Gemmataceae bacterium]